MSAPAPPDVLSSPVLRDFWYPVAPLSRLAQGPMSATLLGESLVLWLPTPTSADAPAAAQDRCSHRRAPLSLGVVTDRRLRCAQHGWAFAADGRCVYRPQFQTASIPASCHVRGFACRARYGYAWVCLGVPRADIPTIPDGDDPSFRRIDSLYEEWKTSAPRVMEHVLHTAPVRSAYRPPHGPAAPQQPANLEVVDRGPYEVGVRSPRPAGPQGLTAQYAARTPGGGDRTIDIVWHMPFTLRLSIGDAGGLRHTSIHSAVPVAPARVKVVQFHFRSDREADLPAQEFLATERRIAATARRILEAGDPDRDWGEGHDAHSPTARATLLMRKKFQDLLAGQISRAE